MGWIGILAGTALVTCFVLREFFRQRELKERIVMNRPSLTSAFTMITILLLAACQPVQAPLPSAG